MPGPTAWPWHDLYAMKNFQIWKFAFLLTFGTFLVGCDEGGGEGSNAEQIAKYNDKLPPSDPNPPAPPTREDGKGGAPGRRGP